MIIPNKIVTFNESVISKLEIILGEIRDEEELINLYHKVERKFNGIDQFIYAMDTLYALNRIDVDEKTRTVKYAI